jgi:branched-chain amino acid transport system substrate-binding protein
MKTTNNKLNRRHLLTLLVLTMIAAMLITSCQPAAVVTTQAQPTAQASSQENPTVAAATGVTTESTAAPASGDTILLPWTGALSGGDGADGQTAAKAGQLAVDQTNAAGGVCGGKKLVFKAYDTKSDPKEAANVASLIADDKTVLASISCFSSSALLAEAPIFAEAHILSVAHAAAAAQLTERAGVWAYRVYPSAENQAMFFVDYLMGKKGYKNFAIIYENEDFGVNLTKITEDEIIKRGGKIIAKEAVLKDQTDVSAVVSKFKAANPEAVIGYIQYQVGSYYMLQSKKIKFDAPIYGFDGFYTTEFTKLAGEAAEGVYTLAPYNINSTDPIVANFVKAYRDEFGQDPNSFAGYTYDAATTIIKAIKETNCAGKDAIKEYFEKNIKGKTYAGVTGSILIGDNRDRTFAPGMYTLVQVQNGQFVPIPTN